MSEHIPSVTFVQPTRRKRSLKRMRFRLVTVKEAHFFGVIEYTVDGNPIYAVTQRSEDVTNREKTLAPKINDNFG